MNKLLDDVKKTFAEHKIKYFSGNNSNENILNLPYRGIENTQNHVNIYMAVDNKLNVIKFMVVEKANMPSKTEAEIKSKLLDINSTLNFGALSMRNDSDSIEYKIEYELFDEPFSFSLYNKYIVRCITVYEKLKEEDLI